jgi:GT2 family glycosyltransferase
MNEPLVWVLILNFNKAADTLECVESLREINYKNYKILIVDNGSTDDSYITIKNKIYNEELIQSEENLGYTGGINFGIKYLQLKNPDYILVLNNDTIVSKNFLDELVRSLEKNKSAAAATGTILCEHNHEEIWYASGKVIPWRGLAVHSSKGKKFDFMKSDIEETNFISGCMVLFRNSSLGEIGLEDERFFMYLDDIEFSLRILEKGYLLLYVPRAIIYHKVLGEKESAFKYYYSVRNRLLLISVSFYGFYKIVAKFYFFIVIIGKIFVWKFSNPAFCKAAKTGLRDYFLKNFYKGNGSLFYSK